MSDATQDAAPAKAPRPAAQAPRPAPQRAAQPVGGTAAREGGCHSGGAWFMAIPRRVWFALLVVAAPFRVLGWALDFAVSALVVGIAAAAWAWWAGHISDTQVAWFLGQLGERGLAILSGAGLL